MDPDACLQRIASAPLHSAELRDACEDLRHWLARGGFAPNWGACPVGRDRYRRAWRHAWRTAERDV